MSSLRSVTSPERISTSPNMRLDEGRLAGAVGPDDPDEFAVVEGQVDARQDVDPGQVAGDDIDGATRSCVSLTRSSPWWRPR